MNKHLLYIPSTGKKILGKFIKKQSKKTGLSPGTMIHVGDKKVEKVLISVLDYDREHLHAKDLPDVKSVIPFINTPSVSWINITGLHEVDILEKIGKGFNIHPLVLEDILNTDQRPKLEVFDDYIFIVLKMLSFDETRKEVSSENISVILSQNYVITFQEREGDVFNPLRNRLNNPLGRLRKHGTDYLAYAILDVIVDHYFILLEKLGEKIETLEEVVIENPNQAIVAEIQFMKRELIFLRKSIWPLREVINEIVRDENPFLSDFVTPYLRDVYDHTIQVMDTVDTYRDMVTGILDIYLSSISNRMNEVMKVLTIIATIFIPLTFIAGVYGMNFEFMPELKWRWGYPSVWFVMMFVFIGMVIYFKRKRWL
jgi:magnesium transporter